MKTPPSPESFLPLKPNWFHVLQTPFMRNAFLGGSLVAIASGLIGYFTVVRQNAFAAQYGGSTPNARFQLE